MFSSNSVGRVGVFLGSSPWFKSTLEKLCSRSVEVITEDFESSNTSSNLVGSFFVNSQQLNILIINE